MSIFFTSDTHFCHKNIIRYCNRPFENTNKMDKQLINLWNSVVKKDDIVYHLGDFSFHNATTSKKILEQLNGHKFLIKGNHDCRITTAVNQGFDAACELMTVKIGSLPVYLCHYPYKKQEIDDRNLAMLEDQGNWLICGHVHNAWQQKRRTINVGVDVWAFTPVSETIIAKIMGE